MPTSSALESRPEAVVVRNVYHLMAYAFQAIDVKEYRKLASEDFCGMNDLLAAILLIGIEAQRKRGFEHGYKCVEEQGWRIKGRLDMRRSMNAQILSGKPEAYYQYDEYVEDTLLNRILKTSALALVGRNDVDINRRRRLRGALAFMQNVSRIENPSRIRWSELRYHRNNRSYELLMNVCYMVIRQLLLSSSTGDLCLAMYDDAQQFSKLYERFILNYYKRHFPQLNAQGQKTIKPDATAPSIAPSMNMDVTLSHAGKTLILEAKCYGTILGMHYDEGRLSAEHIRQIFYYATHSGSPKEVSALLVYAGTSEGEIAENWEDQGYKLGCMTLDLDQNFGEISKALDGVVKKEFGVVEKAE